MPAAHVVVRFQNFLIRVSACIVCVLHMMSLASSKCKKITILKVSVNSKSRQQFVLDHKSIVSPPPPHLPTNKPPTHNTGIFSCSFRV